MDVTWESKDFLKEKWQIGKNIAVSFLRFISMPVEINSMAMINRRSLHTTSQKSLTWGSDQLLVIRE
jgi:hypothetical protein